MSDNITLDANKEALLLRENKMKMVEALQNLNVLVTMETALSEIAELTKWVGGLRDIRLAALRSDNTVCYFTKEEWNELTVNAKSTYTKLGINIRARMKDIIVSFCDIPNSSGGTTHKFGSYGRDLTGVKNYGGGSSGVYNVANGLADTQSIVTQCAGRTDNNGTVGAPAAEAAWNYKVCENDPLQWYLPSVSELLVIAEYRDEFNQFINDIFGGTGRLGDWYWSSTEYDSSFSWSCIMSNGNTNNCYRYYSFRVRAVCLAN